MFMNHVMIRCLMPSSARCSQRGAVPMKERRDAPDSRSAARAAPARVSQRYLPHAVRRYGERARDVRL